MLLFLYQTWNTLSALHYLHIVMQILTVSLLTLDRIVAYFVCQKIECIYNKNSKTRHRSGSIDIPKNNIVVSIKNKSSCSGRRS